MTYRLVKAAFAHRSALGIQCLVCGRISYHPEDIRERYCGSCHRFHEDAEEISARRGTLGNAPPSRTAGAEPGVVGE